MAADRRIDAAVKALALVDLGVERFAHPMQALELEIFVAGKLENGGDGQRVVRRELRIELWAGGKQPLGAGEIAEVGRGFSRKNRKIGKPALLRALDLGVPISALDEPHHQAAAGRAARLRLSQSITCGARF